MAIAAKDPIVYTELGSTIFDTQGGRRFIANRLAVADINEISELS